ncbi:MAG TPA: GNAT family protein [Gammaproteobacteria bacterium]|nr:GNAT family protein [Gammaproteobacteria bacterium]
MANRLVLERPTPKRQREFLGAVERSRALHATYVAPPRTPEEYRAYLLRQRGEGQESFFVLAPEDRGLAGVININEIVRHSFQSGSLGYYAFEPYAGRGLMREGLRIVVGLAFKQLGLHRLEANIQPGNERSIALVASLGFRLEGLSPRFLKIAGRWRDHLRWAILADEWRSGGH